jgi:hypothetical protein
MKKYLDAAKQEGVTPTSGGELLTIATNADPGNQTAQVAQAQLNKMGFKLNYRKVPQDTLYTKFCNVPSQKIAICPNVGWFKDFNDPQAVLDAVFNGKNIIPANNSNWTQLNVPAINDAMGKAALLPAGPERSTGFLDYFFAPDADPAWVDELLEFDRQVGAEDRVLVERVQKGVRSGIVAEGQLLGESEQLVARFQQLVAQAVA